MNSRQLNTTIRNHLGLMSDPRKRYSDMPLLLRPKTIFPEPEVTRLLGGRQGANLSRSTQKKLRRWTAHVDEVAKPEIIYSINSIESIQGSVVSVDNGTEIKSAKVAQTLKRADAFVCFVATLGDRIENTIGILTDNRSISDAYIVDAVGSVGVEQLVEGFQGAMESVFRTRNKGLTLRFSPGYCDWPLREQKKLFTLVEADLIGVSLSECCLMTPRKSVSGIFGITNHPSQSISGHNPCILCTKKDCISRRSPKPVAVNPAET
jgi:Vitamin B12 dependent methionine synthase, activation domain